MLEKIWGQFAAQQVILGYLPQPNKKIIHLLEWYLTVSEGQKSATDQMANMVWLTGDGENIAMGRLFQTIGCQEIWGEMYTGREIKKGQLIASGENLCKKSPMSNRYDSKNFSIQTPIYYLQGSHDPTTTLEHARYHFANQTQSKQKFFVNVKKASHAPLSVTLRPCSEFIWKSIADGGKDFAKIINQCAENLGAEVELITP